MTYVLALFACRTFVLPGDFSAYNDKLTGHQQKNLRSSSLTSSLCKRGVSLPPRDRAQRVRCQAQEFEKLYRSVKINGEQIRYLKARADAAKEAKNTMEEKLSQSKEEEERWKKSAEWGEKQLSLMKNKTLQTVRFSGDPQSAQLEEELQQSKSQAEHALALQARKHKRDFDAMQQELQHKIDDAQSIASTASFRADELLNQLEDAERRIEEIESALDRAEAAEKRVEALEEELVRLSTETSIVAS